MGSDRKIVVQNIDYKNKIEDSIQVIEVEMKNITEENIELVAKIRRAEDARERLEKNRLRLKELAKIFSEMEVM